MRNGICIIEGCKSGRPIIGRGFCSIHYHRWWRNGDPHIERINAKGLCSIEGCDKSHYAKGLCMKHRKRQRIHGDPMIVTCRPGGTGSISGGYLRIQKNGIYYREHRKIMEDFLNRKLQNNEKVHHKNGDKLDNRIENLELWIEGHPSGQRLTDLILWAKMILDKYGHEDEILQELYGSQH